MRMEVESPLGTEHSSSRKSKYASSALIFWSEFVTERCFNLTKTRKTLYAKYCNCNFNPTMSLSENLHFQRSSIDQSLPLTNIATTTSYLAPVSIWDLNDNWTNIQLCSSLIVKGKSAIWIWYMMVLGQHGAVLVGTWWYWISVTWYCLVLSGTMLLPGFYACIYWKKWRFGWMSP